MPVTPLSSQTATKNAFHLSPRATGEDDAENPPSHVTVNFSPKKSKKRSRQQQILDAATKAVASVDEKYGARRSLEARKAARAMITEGEQSTVETSEETLEKLQKEMEAQAQEAQIKAAEKKEKQAEVAEEKRQEAKAAADRAQAENASATEDAPAGNAPPKNVDPLPGPATTPAMPATAPSPSPPVSPSAEAAAPPQYHSTGESSHAAAPLGDVVNVLV